MPTPVIIAGDVIVGECERVRAARTVRAASSFGQAEVQHLDRAVGRDLDVGRLQIAMDDAVLVRRFERLGNLPRDRQRFVDGQRAARDPVGERVALDQLQDERVDVAAVLEPVDRRDVRMVERGQHLRLAPEAREAIRIERQTRRAAPSARRRAELGIARAIHLAHAAGAERADDLVRADAACRFSGIS